ncbi:MAG: TlpA disulfide reductase family protein [Candidatus Poribacteria bacterium]|nr:TlpA disulfide reductase family protein [Candidatus Poribacteria bacterium]
MLKTILQLKISDSRSLLLYTLTTLLILTSVAFADEKQYLFHLEDLKDPGSLAVKLQDTRAAISQYIAAQLSAETQQLLGEYDGASTPPSELQKALLDDLNRLLEVDSLYDAQSFTDIALSEQTQVLLARNPQSGEDLIRLNRSLLTDAYPYELVSPSEKQKSDDSTGIERCRENLRQIQLALEKHRAGVGEEPQWLSELSPEYLKKNVLLCPADTTVGVPGVLTEGGSDPTLPCSYLYQFRPDQKARQGFLLEIEGDMLPIVHCEHHLLNLSVSGKIYRKGPQRKIYNNSTVKSISIQTNSPSDLPEEVRKQIEEQPLKGGNNPVNRTVFQINASDNPRAKLKEQFGEAFLESPEGKALLNQLTTASIDREKFAFLLEKPMPDITLMTLSGKPVKLETLRGKFALVNLFSTDSTPSGPKLKQLEKLFTNYDATQLQVVGISTDDSGKAIAAFKEKHQLSMPIWRNKNDQIQKLLNRDASEPQTELITLLLNRELVVKDVFIDFDPENLSQKVKKLFDAEK